MRPIVRRALLDAFEEHGLLAYTKPEPEIAVDELGRLRKTLVNKVLEDFDENVRSGSSLSWKSCTLSLEVGCNSAHSNFSSRTDVGLRRSVIHGNMSVQDFTRER